MHLYGLTTEQEVSHQSLQQSALLFFLVEKERFTLLLVLPNLVTNAWMLFDDPFAALCQSQQTARNHANSAAEAHEFVYVQGTEGSAALDDRRTVCTCSGCLNTCVYVHTTDFPKRRNETWMRSSFNMP